eukprot:PhF_6_TR33944/c0_g1_i2/m.49754
MTDLELRSFIPVFATTSLWALIALRRHYIRTYIPRPFNIRRHCIYSISHIFAEIAIFHQSLSLAEGRVGGGGGGAATLGWCVLGIMLGLIACVVSVLPFHMFLGEERVLQLIRFSVCELSFVMPMLKTLNRTDDMYYVVVVPYWIVEVVVFTYYVKYGTPVRSLRQEFSEGT